MRPACLHRTETYSCLFQLPCAGCLQCACNGWWRPCVRSPEGDAWLQTGDKQANFTVLCLTHFMLQSLPATWHLILHACKMGGNAAVAIRRMH